MNVDIDIDKGLVIEKIEHIKEQLTLLCDFIVKQDFKTELGVVEVENWKLNAGSVVQNTMSILDECAMLLNLIKKENRKKID
jgi:hypothetical protein